MNIDTLLNEAAPDRALTLRERAEVERLVDSVAPGRLRRRPRLLVGIAALSALLLAGGATAAAATGVWHPSWYDADSDWTTEVTTVHRAFTVDGRRYHCTVTFSLGSTYDGTGTPDFQKALSYFRSLDPLTVEADPAKVDELIDATWVGQGTAPAPPSRAWADEQVWTMTVTSDVATHLTAIGLDAEHVQFPLNEKCDFSR